MSIPAAIVLGILIGWLIEWVIDWLYWRRKTPAAERTAAMAAASTREHDALLAENAELKSRAGQLDSLNLRLRDCEAVQAENAGLKSRLAELDNLTEQLRDRDALYQENTEIKSRMGEYAGLSDRVSNYDALLEENARLKSQLEAYTIQPDDLKVIVGIGPEIERRLNQAGITTFAQMAQLTPADLERILGDVIKRLSNEQSLIDQARELAARGR